jgi:NADH:quinone reductase (non-electrogenic)
MNDVASRARVAETIGSPPDDQELQPARPAARSARQKPRIVIVGGGFAGLAAAHALRHADAEVVLIDRRNHHIFQPLLYQVATAVLSPAEIAAPIRQLEVKQRNLSVLLAEVTGVDVASRTIEASSPGVGARKIAFDYLVVASGMRPSYFGHDEFARYAPGLKSLNDAETIRAKILSAFELAEVTEDEGERARQMTFVLVGAGPTGVELAASLAQMVRVTLSGNFRRIDPSRSTIILLDAGNRVLPTFVEPLSRGVTRRLTKLGVEVMTGVKVETVDEQGVVAGGTRIPSATVLWTAGVAASPIPKMLGSKTDRAGRALVDPFLRIVDAPGVFVAGDAALVMQNEHPVPGVAQAAIQEGRFVGRLIAKELKRRRLKRPFRYFDKGNMAVVGKNYAVLERGWLRTSGLLTWLVWAFVHILSLPQSQNRLRVQRQWLWSYFTGQRGSRLIPEPPQTPGAEAR